MTTRPNVTTPGGFFVGLGGIVSFCVVAAVVWQWVKKPAPSDELRPQQVALGLRAAADAKIDDVKKKDAESAALIAEAAKRYNGGVKPDLDNLDDLRGVVRYREAQKSIAEAGKALHGAVAWKDKAKGEVTMPIELAMQAVATTLKDRKPKPSAVKVDIFPPADPTAAPMMPNAMLGGARTVFFADPNAVPVVTPALPPAPGTASPAPPAAPPAPSAAPSATPVAPPVTPVAPPVTPAAPPVTPVAPPVTPVAPSAPPAAPPVTPAAPPVPPAADPVPPGRAALQAPPTPAASAVPATPPAPDRPPLLNWPESK